MYTWAVYRFVFFTVLLMIGAMAGCHAPGSGADAGQTAANVKVYKLHGKIIALDVAKSEVTVNHEAVPGFMEAMTMPYKLKNPAGMSDLHPGDTIMADLLVSQNENADVLLDHIVVTAQAKPDYKPAFQYHVPAPGDVAPDFALRNQDGRAIHLAQFKGKTVALTFIYTRCLLEEFCPRVTRDFAKLDLLVAADPVLRGKVHLLSVSFDPEHDTPEVLKAYAARYTGQNGGDVFSRWDFAVAPKDKLVDMAHWFDVGMSVEKDTTITHTLSTTILGPDGKVVAFYSGNEWSPEQALADIKKSY